MKQTVLTLLFLTLRILGQDIRITEFLPTNTLGIKDEDGTFQDWIEIWNPDQVNKVSLSGWKIVSDSTTWTFPAVEIMPDDYIVVFASGKNRTVVTAPLHTNFTLSASGGTLSLVRPDTTVASLFKGYPALVANTSFGRDLADVSLVGSYSTPTPGDANNYSGLGISGDMVISVASRTFTSSFSVSLSQVTPVAGAVIRYTLDGSVPVSGSAQYVSPLTISATTRLRARVFEPGKLPGQTKTSGYLLLDGSTSGFNSAMSIVVLSNFGGGTPPDNTVLTDQNAFMWVFEPGLDGLARLSNPPTLDVRAVIDRRGRSTIGNPKWNLNLEARRERDDVDKDISLLGMPDGSDWVFHAPWEFDRALIRNPIVYELSRSIDRYAVRHRMAEVFIDSDAGALTYTGAASGNYFGVYNIFEKIRRGKDRVAIAKLDTYDNDAVGKTGGFIWKVDSKDTGDTGFSAGGQSMAYYYPNESSLKSPQRDPQEQYLTTYINSFKTALDSANYTNPATGYAAWLDVAGCVDHHLLNVWVMNVDALRLSGYWHKERGGKMIAGPVWDFDRTMQSTDSRDDDPATWRSAVGDRGTDFFNYTWWNRMFTDPDFYQSYIDRWVELRRGPYSTATFNALVDQLNNSISSEAITRDIARWGKTKRAYGGLTGQPAEVLQIKDWMAARAAFMESQWIAPVTLSHAGGNVSPGLQVTMSGPVGATIFYTVNGSDPRPSGGGAAGGSALIYKSPITINATTRIKARAYNASWTALTGANNPPLVSKWSGPTSARYSTDTPAAPGALVVTEVCYNPLPPTPAELAVNPVFEAADFEFIELKNIGTVPIDLGNVRFSKGIDFTFSGDNATTLAPGALIVVAANTQAFKARYPAVSNYVGPYTGKLDNAGEQVRFLTPGGATILNFTYDNIWYPTTDGGGRTLAIYNPGAPSAAFSLASNWRASAAIGGSPGANEPNLPPAVSAGEDRVGYLPSIFMAGTVDDDGQASAPVTVAWSKVSGPGSVSFGLSDGLVTLAKMSLPGNYALRLSASDGLLPSLDEATISMRDTPGAWLLRHPGIGTLNDDANGNMRTNFYEWALVLDPLASGGGDGVTLGLEGGHLTLTYKRHKDSPYVRYTPQATGNVNAWADPEPGDISETILADDGVMQTVKATDNSTAGTARFMRLKLTPLQ